MYRLLLSEVFNITSMKFTGEYEGEEEKDKLKRLSNDYYSRINSGKW